MDVKKNEKKHKDILFKALAVVFALVLWEITAKLIDEKIILVGPIAVFKRLLSIWQEPYFFDSIVFSMTRIAAGFFAAFIIGLILAAMAYHYKFIEYIIWPFMITVKSVPVASFVVICLIVFTARNLGALISFLVVLPVIYTNVLEGLKSQDSKLLQMCEVFRVGFIKKTRHVTLPAISTHLISATKISAGMAWKAGVAAEIIGIPEGSIGKMLYLSKIYIDTDDLLAWTVVIVVISVLFEKTVVWLSGKITRV